METHAPAAAARPIVERRHIEPRWPVLLAVIVMTSVLVLLPARIRVTPRWATFAVTFVTLLPMVGVLVTRGHPRWVAIERKVILTFCVVVGLGMLFALRLVVYAMLRESGKATGLQLLSSGAAVWIMNICIFSLLYWQLDRGGPEARANDDGVRPDWQFAQSSAPDDAPPGWRPTFVDYLALGFCTSTAFSPTDALPLTSRAKLLMMLESLISLVTIVIVASRAINILGS